MTISEAAKRSARKLPLVKDFTTETAAIIIQRSIDTETQAKDEEVQAMRKALEPVDSAVCQSGPFYGVGSESYTPEFHIEITITVAEARAIRAALAGTPSPNTYKREDVEKLVACAFGVVHPGFDSNRNAMDREDLKKALAHFSGDKQ